MKQTKVQNEIQMHKDVKFMRSLAYLWTKMRFIQKGKYYYQTVIDKIQQPNIETMKTKQPRELGLTSRISSAVPPAQNLGSLTPVHLDDVIKNRNLDYLENLGELVERTPASPIWYDYQSAQNKMKFLQIYQYSINYAKNTFDIYDAVLSQLNDQFSIKKAKVDKLKSQIIDHKQKTSKLKRQFKKQKLIKERQKVLNYEKSLKAVRDNMKKQQKQLQAQNQEKMRQIQELKRKQKNHLENESRLENPFAFIQQPPPPPHPYYQYYPYPPPPQPYYHQGYAPPPPHEHGYLQPPPQFAPPNNRIEESVPLKRSQSSKQTFNPGKQLGASGGLKRSQNDLKQSQKSKQEANSDKTWTLRNTNPLMQSNVESQKQDFVEELNQRKSSIVKRASIQNSKFSTRKNSNLQEADIDSFLDIQLKTQSKNDIELGNNLDFKRTTSILGKKKNSNKVEQKLPAVDEVVESPTHKIQKIQEQPQNNKQVQSIKKYNNNMSVKITAEKPPSIISDASLQSSTSRGFGYLEQSNQGHKITVGQNLFKGGLKNIRLKESGNIGRSIANSLDDVQSKNGSKLMLEEQVYQDDFQTSGDLQGMTLTQKTRVKVNVQFSQSSPQKERNLQFAPLYKNYFILKDEVVNMEKSKEHSQTVKSMRQFSIKFMGGDKNKIQNKSQLGLQENSSTDMMEIDMPMNSIIAKPSKMKMSTIVRKSAIEKINKSHDPKLPANFIAQSPRPAKQVRFAEKTDVMDDNFANIGDIPMLNSVNTKKNNFPPAPPRPEEKLASLQMAQSHVIEEINEEDKSDCQKAEDLDRSVSLSAVMEQSENESMFTQQNSSNQKILLLIDKKYKQKGAAEFDKQVIKNQISELQKQKKTQELDWQEIADAFNQLIEKKQEQIQIFVESWKNKAKTNKKKVSSRQSSQKILKNHEKIKSNISRIQQKKQEEDDLIYSRSHVQNPSSSELAIKKKESAQSLADVKKEPEEKEMVKTKYIREQKQTNNNRMLQKIIEKSKFDQDDQLENAIKANYRQKSQEKDILDNLEDSF